MSDVPYNIIAITIFLGIGWLLYTRALKPFLEGFSETYKNTPAKAVKQKSNEKSAKKGVWEKRFIFAAWVVFCFWYFPEKDGWLDTLRRAFIAPAFTWVVVYILLGGPKGAARWGGGMLMLAGVYLAPFVIFGYWLEMPLVAAACVIGLTIWLSLGGGDPPDGGLDGSNY